MSVKSGQAVTVLFATANATTGAAADASSTPTGTLYVNGTANGATVTVTNITTGVYKAAVTLPALSAGDVVSLRIAATVSAVAGEGIVWQDVADTKRVSDLNDLGGTAQSGDAYARLGAPAGASVSADIAAIEAQTDDIGVAGAGLTAIGDARLANLDATVSSRSTLDAAGVWSHATRTLSSFGTLVADIWANVTRTLTAQADSAGVTTLLSRVVGTLAAGTHQPQTGDAYARLGAPAGVSVSADIANVPTVAEFEARTLPSADYTVVSDLPSVPSAADNATASAAAILATPANKLATDAIGRVTPDAVTPATDVSALALEATVQSILTDTGTDGVVVADKTGYQLAADGLDAITATEPTGKPTTFAGWVMWLVQRFRRADMTTTTLTVKTEAGATVTQQTVSDDGTTQSIGAPS